MIGELASRDGRCRICMDCFYIGSIILIKYLSFKLVYSWFADVLASSIPSISMTWTRFELFKQTYDHDQTVVL
jgi:hypothetical protein